jgi:hypothetical protein
MTYQPIYFETDDTEKFSKIKDEATTLGFKNCMEVLNGDALMVQMTKEEKIREEFNNCEFTNNGAKGIEGLQFDKFKNQYLDGMAKAERKQSEKESKETTKNTVENLSAF